MAIDRHMARAVVPVYREWHGARRLIENGWQMARGEVSTIMGGLLAIVAVAGLILLAALGRDIPTELGILATASGLWYFGAATPAVVTALTRRASGDQAPEPEPEPGYRPGGRG